MNTNEWSAKILEEGEEFVAGIVRVIIWRSVGTDRAEIVTTKGNVIQDSGVKVDRSVLPAFPKEAFRAMVEAALPDPSRALFEFAKESLSIERERVDRLTNKLATFVPIPPR